MGMVAGWDNRLPSSAPSACSVGWLAKTRGTHGCSRAALRAELPWDFGGIHEPSTHLGSRLHAASSPRKQGGSPQSQRLRHQVEDPLKAAFAARAKTKFFARLPFQVMACRLPGSINPRQEMPLPKMGNLEIVNVVRGGLKGVQSLKRPFPCLLPTHQTWCSRKSAMKSVVVRCAFTCRTFSCGI